MPLNLTGLDDPVAYDNCPTFTGGQQSFMPPDQLPAEAAQYLLNVDITDGTATTRRGAETLGVAGEGRIQGLWWYDTPSRERLAAVVGQVLQEYDGATWAVAPTYITGGAKLQVCMCQLIDRLYLADGTASLGEWDGTTFTSITAAPKGAFIITSYGQIWMAGDAANPDTLSRSALLDGATWDSTHQSIRIGGGEGDPITGLCEWDDYKVVVFKRSSIYLVTADPRTTNGTTSEDDFGNAIVTKLSDTLGCVSHRSIARVANDVFFLSDDGVFSLGRVIADNQREIKQASSLPVQDVIDRINWRFASNAAGFFWNNRYFLSLPLDDDELPFSTLVFSTKRVAWSGLWEGWSPLVWALEKPNGLDRLVFGRSTGEVWRWLDYVRTEGEVEETYSDAGNAYPTRITSRAMIFKDAYSPKSLLSTQLEFFRSRASATATLQLDESPNVTLSSAFSTASGVLLLDFDLPATLPNDGVKRRAFGGQHVSQFRSIQVVVESPSDKLSLRGVLMEGFVNTVKLEE